MTCVRDQSKPWHHRVPRLRVVHQRRPRLASAKSQATMLQQRRQITAVIRQGCRRQQRRCESNFAKDNDTSSTGHHASAGKAEPTHHGHHPEPVNESLGVCRSPLRSNVHLMYP